MPLPDDFDAYQHLLEQIKIQHNLQIEQSFIGVEANDISTGMGSLRTACFITDDDTVDMMMLRLFLYHFKLRKDLPTPVYGIPAPDYQSQVTFKPTIKLFFIEPYTERLRELKLNQATAEISFRLMNFTNHTINKTEVLPYAERIKAVFGEGMGYVWTKGKINITYRDLSKGIKFRLFAESEGEGTRVIQSVLEVAEQPFDEQKLTITTNHKIYLPESESQIVYGMEVKSPRKRPITQVRFSRAELHVYGLEHAISLVDLSRKTIPLVR